MNTCPRVRLLCSRHSCRMMICSRVRRGLLGGCMDVLSEVLKVVKLQGALFYNAEFSSPWSVYAASSRELARYYGIDTEHVIVYHLLTEGRGSVRLDNGNRLSLEAGDIVMIPHGD